MGQEAICFSIISWENDNPRIFMNKEHDDVTVMAVSKTYKLLYVVTS